MNECFFSTKCWSAHRGVGIGGARGAAAPPTFDEVRPSTFISKFPILCFFKLISITDGQGNLIPMVLLSFSGLGPCPSLTLTQFTLNKSYSGMCTDSTKNSKPASPIHHIHLLANDENNEFFDQKPKNFLGLHHRSARYIENVQE